MRLALCKAPTHYMRPEPQHRELCALLFLTSVWVLKRPLPCNTKDAGDGTYGYLSEKTRTSDHLQI